MTSIEPFLRELGRLVLNFNALEQYARLLVHALIAGDEVASKVSTHGADARRLEEVLSLLAEIRDLRTSTKADLYAFIKRFSGLRDSRNALVHATWRVPNDAIDLSQVEAARPPRGRSTDSRPVEASRDPASLGEIASACSDACTEAERLLEKVRGEVRGMYA
jgi:hypothetical protein